MWFQQKPPDMIIKVEGSTGRKSYTGLFIEILDLLSKAAKFT